MNPVLEFKSVTIRYPGNSGNTIDNVSFHVHPDERVALFGLNGSGKTTLLLAAVGLVSFIGFIFIDGIPVEKKNLQKVRDRTGFLFNIPEDQILFPRVIDDVAYGLIRRGMPLKAAHEKAISVLAALSASDIAECSPFQLSHGHWSQILRCCCLMSHHRHLIRVENCHWQVYCAPLHPQSSSPLMIPNSHRVHAAAFWFYAKTSFANFTIAKMQNNVCLVIYLQDQ